MRKHIKIIPEKHHQRYFDSSIQPPDLPDVDIFYNKHLIRISYRFNGFNISDSIVDTGKNFKYMRIEIPETGFFSDEYMPMLPSFGRYVEIPSNCGFSFRYQKEPTRNLRPEVDQEHFYACPFTYPESNKTSKNLNAYGYNFGGRKNKYPDPDTELVQISGPFSINGRNTLLLHVRPISYDSVENTLTLFGIIDVSIQLLPEADSKWGPHTHSHRENDAFLNLFIHPIDSESSIQSLDALYDDETEIRPQMEVSDNQSEFLIFHKDPEFEKQAAELCKWKNDRGLKTKIVPVNPSVDTLDKWRERIKARILQDRPNYVLLLGHIDSIPTFFIKDRWNNHEDTPTDYFYTTRASSTDDPAFLDHDAVVGRIPVRDQKQAENAVKRIISYEKYPPNEEDYYEKLTFVAHFEDKGDPRGKDERSNIQSSERIRRHLFPQQQSPWGTQRKYRTQGFYVTNPQSMACRPSLYLNEEPIPDDVTFLDYGDAISGISSAFNNKHLIVTYMGHGWEEGWTYPPFDRKEMQRFGENSEGWSVVYSIACQTGKFDVENFSKLLLRITNGAPSVIAATGKTLFFVDEPLIVGLFDASWAGLIPPFPRGRRAVDLRHNRLGDILKYAKTYVQCFPSRVSQPPYGNPEIIEAFWKYQVIGDPSLEVWKGPPSSVTVTPEPRPFGHELEVTIDPCPPDSYLTLWEGEQSQRRLLRGNGKWKRKTIFSRNSNGGCRLCFWASGYRYQEKIIPESPAD